MRYIVSVLVFMAALFSLSVGAALLPQLSRDFPAGWVEIGNRTCTPKQGTTITISVYRREHVQGSETVTLTSKNGSVLVQDYMVFAPNGQILSGITIVDDGGKAAVINYKNHGDGKRILARMFKVLGVTPEEFKNCKKEKR